MLTAPFVLQHIPPSSAKLCLSIEKFLLKDLGFTTSNRHFIVGFSGGIDSTALLLILHLLKPRTGMHVVAAHLDHGIRIESKEEKEHCKKICKAWEIPFYSKSVSVPDSIKREGKGIEETSRSLRYAFFNQVRKNFPHSTIVLGHHLNDLAEDVLMRIIRGSGWPALSGMSAKDDKRGLCRPLLLTPKSALRDFITNLGVPYVHDTSNDDLHYFRNRVRHTILPLFIDENPSFLQNIANLWSMGRLDEELFAHLLSKPVLPDNSAEKSPLKINELSVLLQANASYATQPTCMKVKDSNTLLLDHPLSKCFLEKEKREKNNNISNSVSKARLDSMPRSLRLRLYKKVLEQLDSHPLAANLLQLDTLWVEKKTGSILQFPHSVTATIERGAISFVCKK